MQGEDSEVFNLNRQSGYMFTGGMMRSDFVGSTAGKNGIIYGNVDNILGTGADIRTKVQFLKYLLDTKSGLGIGHEFVSQLLDGDPRIRVQTYHYKSYNTVWTYTRHNSTRPGIRSYYIKTTPKKGLLINNDTIK